MELKLVVLAGAKQGTEIPLKKDQFVIGRAKECTLRAGSEAISRRHCAIVRKNDGWQVRDLGSRNGTYVNDQRIEAETPLTVGDELRVGPLRFRIAPIVKLESAAPAGDAKPTKQPTVRSVEEAAQRTADKSDDLMTEDDISRWLLGIAEPNTGATLKETRTIRMEETATLKRAPNAAGTPPAGEAEVAAEPPSEGEADPSEAPATSTAEEATGKSGWHWMKLNKGGDAKRKPGKLPPRSNEASTKDSREAAADILREMTRRR